MSQKTIFRYLDYLDCIADEACAFNQECLRLMPDEVIPDLEARIAALHGDT
jgi:hypothetical protein